MLFQMLELAARLSKKKKAMLFRMLELAVRLGKKKAIYTGTLPQTKTTGPKRASSWLDRFENRASYMMSYL